MVVVTSLRKKLLTFSLLLFFIHVHNSFAKTEKDETGDKHAVKRCYNKWNKFRDDVSDSKGYAEFIICPGTTFKPGTYTQGGGTFTDLEINGPNISILCGEDGAYDNKCTITGGLSHMSIGDDAGANILISGIKFEKTTDTAINAFGPVTSHMKIRDCVFERNEADGGSAIDIWFDDNGVSNGMEVTVQGCSFIDNTGQDGVIVVQGGSLIVENSIFSGTKGGWTIEVYKGGTMDISNSCFVDNYGPVYLYAGSYVINNSNNYGENTENDPDYICSGLLEEGASFVCSKFSASSCMAQPLTTVRGVGNGSSDKTTEQALMVTLIVFALAGGAWYFMKKKRKFSTKKFDDDPTNMNGNDVDGADSGSLTFKEHHDDDIVRPIYV